MARRTSKRTNTITLTATNTNMLITNKSKVSGKGRPMELDATEVQLTRYNSGRFTLQDCFPNLSADEREFIKSGITADEWEETFGYEN